MKSIGWIGTGVMGLSMASHLMDKGFKAYVFNRTSSKAQRLVDKGACLCASPREVADKADIIFTIVGYPKDVEEVYFSESGILKADIEGKVLVDMTTTEPAIAKRIYEAARLKGASSLDAPVSGGDRGAREATLSIMAGGDQDAFERALPCFQAMGRSIVLEGPCGSGQHTKMANQITIAGTMIGVCEALVYSRKAGLDMDRMLATISKGAAGCWTLDNLAPRVLRNDMEPGFMVDHFVKDLGIAIKEAGLMSLRLEGVELAKKLYEELQGMGLGRKGTQALALALDKVIENADNK